MNGHCVDNGQPELFVKLGEGIQLLHLKHKCSNGFCLSFPVNLCGAELLKLCLGFFVPFHKPIVPGDVLPLVLSRLRIYHDSNYINICKIIAGRH